MKCNGRIISLLIAAISSMGFILYDYISDVYLNMIHVMVSVFYVFAGWWLGAKYDKVKYLSEKDVLTGCYNRRFLIDLFPKLKRLSDRKAQKLIIFLIDVDDFKSINDLYDHATGDRVLQLISNKLTKAFRDSDYIVRWGGDEFVGIFTSTNNSKVYEQQIRLCNELNSLSNVVSTEISLSIGYATYPDDGSELNDLIKVADRKMYSDKRGKKQRRVKVQLLT